MGRGGRIREVYDMREHCVFLTVELYVHVQ